MLRLPQLLRTALCCVPILFSSVAFAQQWQIRKSNKEEYVTLKSLKNFYQFTNFQTSGNQIILSNAKTKVTMACGSQQCTMNSVKFILCDAVKNIEGEPCLSLTDLHKLVDPVLRPNFISNADGFRTVILDPGHGGHDSGARSSIGKEADYTLKVGLLAKRMLEARGYKVVMTRASDVFISLSQRVAIANAVTENAIFISLHFNQGGGSARGIETFTLSPPGVAHYGRSYISGYDDKTVTGNFHDSANIALATSVHGTVLTCLGKNTEDRGIKRARFNVLSGVKYPAILLEGGFLSHAKESRLIDNQTYQQVLAQSVSDAVARYRFAVSSAPVRR